MENSGSKSEEVQKGYESACTFAGIKNHLVLKLKSIAMSRFKHFFSFIIGTALLGFIGLSQPGQAQCPNVDLTTESTEGCIPAVFNFTISGLPDSADRLTWKWSSSDSLVKPNTEDESRTYRTPGTYEPSVVVYDDEGDVICEAELNEGEIEVHENPEADFSVGNSSPCFSENSYQFTDESTEGDTVINNYQWTFGDGNSSKQANPEHSYERAIENPNIVLQVTDENGCTDLTQRRVGKIKVLEALDPGFTVSGTNPDCPETEITFNNNTPNQDRIQSITYDFKDSNNTTRTFTRGSNGWGEEYDTTSFTYTEQGEYNPVLKVKSDSGCVDSFTFVSGVVNVVFNFDTSIVNNQPQCNTDVSFSHTPDPRTQQYTFTFGSLSKRGPFQPHQQPPSNTERQTWSGSHQYPSPGVKSIQLDVSNICGDLDTLYRKQVAIEGPSAAITIPNPQIPLSSSLSPADQELTKEDFRLANRKGCLNVNSINYVRRNSTGGFQNQTNTWRPGDEPLSSPSDTFPFRMVFFNETTDLYTDDPETGDTVLIDRLNLNDTIVPQSIQVNFTGSQLTYSLGNGIDTFIGRVDDVNNPDSFCRKPFKTGVDTQTNENVYIVFNRDGPTNPPFSYRVSYRAGDSGVYRPSTGTDIPQNMHDSDVYKPNCSAPNLVRFTNNSSKNRVYRGPDGVGQPVKRQMFYIDTVESDSVYRRNPLGNEDTLYYQFYQGWDIPEATDNEPWIEVNDSTRQQYLSRTIPFDNDLPYLGVLNEGEGRHGVPLPNYLIALVNNFGFFAQGVNTDPVGLAPDEGFERGFEFDASYDAPGIRDLYEEDFKDTFREDKPDDLSPWGSDDINYLWNFSTDPEARSCTTQTAWASKQPGFLYEQFVDTYTVNNINNGIAEIPLSRQSPFDDTIANNKTRVNVFSNSQIGLADLRVYGAFHDVEYDNNGNPVLRIWDNDISVGDRVAVKSYWGNDEFSGRNCQFSTAPAPYHHFDTSGCWQATLQALDTVTNCPPSQDIQRIFMGPPRADWSEESLVKKQSTTLTTGYSIGDNSFLMDSLGLTCGIQNKNVRVIPDSPIQVCVNGTFNLSKNAYEIKQDSIARLVLTNPSNIPLNATINAQYYVKDYAIISGDTVNIENMRFDIQQKLPQWSDGDPESVIRRGVMLMGQNCQGEDQEIDISETLPSGQCSGTEEWAFIIDSASNSNEKPGFFGNPFDWQIDSFRQCTDTIDIDNDGELDTVERGIRQFNWITNQAWDMLTPPRTFSYDTSGCMDIGFWVRSGNCVDTHFYRNYKFIADLESDFSALNPNTDYPEPGNLFDSLSNNQVGVFQNSSYCPKYVGDTTELLVSPTRDQERIRTYEVDHRTPFMVRKSNRLNPYNNFQGLHDSTETTEYDNFNRDTVYVLCDSLREDTIQIPGGSNVIDTTCVNRTLYPEQVCGQSAINDQPLSQLVEEKTRQTGCGSIETEGKVVLDTFPLLEMGGALELDSFSHAQIGGGNNPTVFDTLPKKSKLYRYTIEVKERFSQGDTVHLVSLADGSNTNIVDTVLTIPNNNLDINELDTAGAIKDINYAGIIEDSSDISLSLQDSTALALIKNQPTSQGAIGISVRFKPMVTDVNADAPGYYFLSTSIENAEGCGGSSSRLLEVGHYARFDPEVPERDNDSVICRNAENDTVFYYNKIRGQAEVHDMGNFPRYFHYRPPGQGGFPPVQWLDDENYWKDPKGVRGGEIGEEFQYERVMWDLNGDGYYETKYNIDSLLYVQDLDRDSTFEKVLDSFDADDDGIKEVVPFYTYDSSGRYDVSMKSIDSTGCVQIMEREELITVTGLTAFIDTIGSDLACAPVTQEFVDDSDITLQYDVQFDNSGNPVDSTKIDEVDEWSWEFNDGKDSVNEYTTPSVTKFFTRNDTFLTELWVKSEKGCVDSSVLTRTGGDSVVVKDGDTLTTNARPMEVEVIGPKPQLTLTNDLQCEPATFGFRDSSEAVTEWVFDKDNGEERTYSTNNFPSDSILKINYDEPGEYNMDIEVFGQVPNTSTDDPDDSFRCVAPVQDTTLPTYDSTRFKVRVKATDEAAFEIVNQDLCPEEDLGENNRRQVILLEEADPAYDSFYWAMGQGDTLLRPDDNSDIEEVREEFYPPNSYDTFDITLMPVGEDTLCYDTAVKPIRTTAITANVDTLPLPEGEDRPRSEFTFTNDSEFGVSYDWHFFRAGTQEGSLADAVENQSGNYYQNAPGEGSVYETDTMAQQRVDYYTDRGYYWVALRAENPEGCTNTDTLKIPNVKDTTYDRSNVFTPNGDGDNDRFTFRVQGDQSFKLEIYNRWGNKVYETTDGSGNNECFWSENRPEFDGPCDESGKDPSNPRGCKYCKFWDGTNQSGNDAPAGTYFYKITYQYEETEDGRGGDGDTETGTVTLIR